MRSSGPIVASLEILTEARAFLRRAATAALAVVALTTLVSCGGGSHYILYRLTISVEVDGEVRTGSSIIQAHFYGGGGSGAGRPYKYYSQVKGVSPVIDLGRHGWLVAALRQDSNEARRRREAYSLSCKYPRDADSLLDVFRLDAADLAKLREGKRELMDGYHPTFVWFPRDGPYTSAEQICPAEFARVIGGGAELRSVTIELVPGATLKTSLDIEAQWLRDMRQDYHQHKGPWGSGTPWTRFIPAPTKFEFK